jgi:3-hydroxyisobutyrate dehydrogenase-like beta-hydroxyacid dehydrogenase
MEFMGFKVIGVMSPGNMGSAIAKILGQNGYDVITCLKGRSDFTRNKAADAGMRDVASLEDLVTEADLVLSILDPGKAVAISEEISQAMKNTGNTPVYADCNATSPQTATELQGIIEGAGAVFVDVGIIGAAPSPGNFPDFCTSGPDAALLDELAGKGVGILNIGPEIGQGSAIKICNGAWNKGAFALYTAVMTAAEHYGFTEHLRGRLPGSQAGTVDQIDQAITRLPTLSGRYIGEMEQIAETFASIGLPPGFHDASAELFRLLNQTPIASERRGEIDPNRTPLDTLKIIVDTLHGED